MNWVKRLFSDKLSDLDKTTLDKLKVRAEIKEIRNKNRLFIFTVITSLILVVAGGIDLGSKINSFLVQKEKEVNFQIDEATVDLVKLLSSSEPAERASASVLVSVYGKNAMPLLLNLIDVPKGEERNYPEIELLIKSLRLIKESGKPDKKDFEEMIIRATSEVIKREVDLNPPLENQTSVIRNIKALCSLVDEKRDTISVILDTITNAKLNQLSSMEKELIEDEIKNCKNIE